MPLYVTFESNENYCVNQACVLCNKSIVFVDFIKATKLQQEMLEKRNAIRSEFAKWRKMALTQIAYKARFEKIQSLWKKGTIKFQDIYILDDFLSMLQKEHLHGNEAYEEKFPALLSLFSEYFKLECTIEDMTRGRFLFSENKIVFIMRYWKVVYDSMLQGLGIVNFDKSSYEGIFRYADVDNEAKRRSSSPPKDLRAYFDIMFDFLTTLKYCFEMYDIVRKRHDYDPTGDEIEALWDLALKCKKMPEIWTSAKIKRQISQKNIRGKAAVDFMRKYCAGGNNAPILIKVDDRIHFDPVTIVFFCHYLFAKSRIHSATESVSGSDSMTLVKDEASKIFDSRLRQFFQNKGYKVVPKETKVKYGDTTKEYDILACNETKKLIAIVEAKYRDTSPSSLTKDAFVNQELLGEDGVLSWAVHQQERLELMPQNIERFNQLLSFERTFEDYERRAYVVTKFPPLIKKYKQVDVLDYPSFCQLNDF
jgi:hypothetical protein